MYEGLFYLKKNYLAQIMRSLTVNISFVSDGYCQMFIACGPDSRVKVTLFSEKNTFLFFNFICFFVMALINQPLEPDSQQLFFSFFTL